jgi:hypothetical protein
MFQATGGFVVLQRSDHAELMLVNAVPVPGTGSAWYLVPTM